MNKGFHAFYIVFECWRIDLNQVAVQHTSYIVGDGGKFGKNIPHLSDSDF